MSDNPYQAEMSDNPYQVTYSTIRRESPGEVGLFRQNGYLIAHKKAAFPDRCIKSNEPTALRLHRVLYWHSPWLFLLLFFNVILFLVVAFIVRKKADFDIPLAERYIRRRRKNIFIACTLVLASVVCFGGVGIFSVNLPSELSVLLLLLGALILIVAGLWSIYGCRIIYAKKIDDQYVKIRGAGIPFLDSLPDFPSIG